jgi:hypothetical protein
VALSRIWTELDRIALRLVHTEKWRMSPVISLHVCVFALMKPEENVLKFITFNYHSSVAGAAECNGITEHHAIKAYWGSAGIAPRILTSVLDGVEWSASRPGRFIPRERAPSTHWIGGWVGPRAGLDAVVKIRIPSPCQDSNPRSYSP